QHLALTRSVDCEPDQIIIVEGSHQAIDLATRILGDPGDVAWVENPGYWGARSVLAANGIRIVHQPVDEEGMQVPTQADGATRRSFTWARSARRCTRACGWATWCCPRR